MFPLAFILIAAGVYFADAAYKNRAPLTTIRDVITNPKDARTILTDSRGTWTEPTAPTVKISPSTESMIAGTGGRLNPEMVNAIIAYAAAQVGKPYQWGAEGPNAYDCSGLMYAAYASVGVSIPRTTSGQVLKGTKVSRKQLMPGDLVFPNPGHVFMYIGNGRTIEAPRTGQKVKYGTVYRFWTARRYV